MADLVFKHFPEWKDKISELSSKLESLNISVPKEMKEFNKALTSCLGNRQVQKTLERFKRNLDIIQKGVARVKELEESFNEDTEKELRQLKNILEVQVKQLEQVAEVSPVQDSISSLASHMQSNAPWRGYADLKPMAEKIASHYKQIRTGYKVQQQEELDNQLSQIKLRPDFGDLEADKQQEVLQLIRKVFVDVDEEAVQPQLLLIKQTPDRIREATSEAHRFMDQLVNESATNGEGSEPDNPKPRVHTIRLNLRNKIISDETELDQVFSRLKQQCLKELNAGIKVRFEE